jgi:hypothetical protein
MATKGNKYTWQVLDHKEIFGKQDHTETSSELLYPLGTIMKLADGRKFRYARAGAVDLIAGQVQASPLTAAQREDTLTVAAAINATSFTFTAAVTMTDDEYAGGMAHIVDGTGQGHQYRIRGNEAIAAASTGLIYLDGPIKVALDTTTDVILTKSPYADVVVAPDQIVMPVGVPTVPVTATYYCWLQTGGVCPVLAEDALGDLATERICILGTTGGYLATDGAAPGTPIVGKHIFDSTNAVSGDYFPIYLTID